MGVGPEHGDGQAVSLLQKGSWSLLWYERLTVPGVILIAGDFIYENIGTHYSFLELGPAP